MKKFTATLLIFGILLSFGAFASDKDDLMNALNADISSGEMALGMKLTMETLLFDTAELGDMIINANGKFNGTQDSGKMQMQMNMSMDFAGVNQDIDYWADMDLSDSENPKFLAIYDYKDGSGKYYYMDMIKAAESNGSSISEMMTLLSDQTKLKEFQKSILDAVPDKEPAVSDGVYTLTYTDKELKEILNGYISATEEYMGISLDEMLGTDFADTAKALANVKLFDENALVLTAKLDESKQLSEVSYVINVDTDVNEISKALNMPSDISAEESAFKAAFAMNVAYSGVNQPVTVNFPVLTEENSIDLLKVVSVQPDRDKINVLYYGFPINFENEPFIENGRTYVPFNDLVNGLYLENASYENNTVSIGDVTLKLNENKLIKNGAEIETDAAAKEVNGVLYVPLRAVIENIGMELTYTQYDDENGIMTGCLIDLKEIIKPAFAVKDGEEEIAAIIEAAGYEALRIPAEDFGEKISAMSAAGEQYALVYSLEDNVLNTYFAPLSLNDEIKAEIEKDSALKEVLTGNGEYVGYPIKSGDKYYILSFPFNFTDTEEYLSVFTGAAE